MTYVPNPVITTGTTTPRSLADRFAETVNVRDFGAVGDGVADDTAAIRNAIDSLPPNGGTIFVPQTNAGYRVTNTVSMDGSSANKSNVRLEGDGFSSYIWLDGASLVPGPSGLPQDLQVPNVIEARTGGGFVLRNLRIEGNRQRGGRQMPYTSAWRTNFTYTLPASGKRYVGTKADGTFESPASPSGRVWEQLVTHTSDATNILNDVALGYWIEITDGSALPRYWSDESFNRNNTVMITGLVGGLAVTDVTVEGCRIAQSRYAQLMLGSGPALADLPNSGVNGVNVQRCLIENGSAGIGGLRRQNARLIGNRLRGLTGNLINFDEGGGRSVVASNILEGVTEDDVLEEGRNGISAYRSSTISIVGNAIRNIRNGIIVQDPGPNNRDLTIIGNTLEDCRSVGIVVNSCPSVAITGNSVRSSTLGIKIGTSNGCTVTGNTVESCTYGIWLENLIAASVTGNVSSFNKGSGFVLQGVRRSSLTGNTAQDNNSDAAAVPSHENGSGFWIGPFNEINTNNVSICGNVAFDSRSPRLQTYGLEVKSGTTGLVVTSNNFLQNATNDVNNDGSQNAIGFNAAASTASLRTKSAISPDIDNSLDFGGSALRWANVFASTIRPGTGTLRWTAGTGSPEGSVTAPVGSLYTRDDGGASTTLYIKETGTGNTGWVAK
jgi:parallel beta-helix repeat protein